MTAIVLCMTLIALIRENAEMLAARPRLNEVSTTLVCSCCKPCHIANDATAQSNEGGLAVQPTLQGLVPDLLKNLQGLVLLPVWKNNGFNFEGPIALQALHKSAACHINK